VWPAKTLDQVDVGNRLDRPTWPPWPMPGPPGGGRITSGTQPKGLARCVLVAPLAVSLENAPNRTRAPTNRHDRHHQNEKRPLDPDLCLGRIR
jgi:hypothetical protein